MAKHRWNAVLHRTETTVGGIVGAVLTLAITGTLDRFLPHTKGGWSDAIRQSVLTTLGHPWEKSFLIRLLFGLGTFLFMTLVGAVIGVMFAFLISGFFRRMSHFLDRHGID